MRTPMLSVAVIVQNEADLIEGCLRSVQWADDIVVVDVMGHDGTTEICRDWATRVISRPWTRFDEQRNTALQAARGEWVLSSDADERVSRPLADEVRALVSSDPHPTAARIPIHTYCLGRRLRSDGANRVKVRLFRRRGARWHGGVHEELRLPAGPVGRMLHPIEHTRCTGVRRSCRKIEHYAGARAREPERFRASVGELGVMFAPVEALHGALHHQAGLPRWLWRVRIRLAVGVGGVSLERRVGRPTGGASRQRRARPRADHGRSPVGEGRAQGEPQGAQQGAIEEEAGASVWQARTWISDGARLGGWCCCARV